jgi:hypothetical protein
MATTQHAIIVGVFGDRIQAEQARKELLGAGCSQEQIKTSMDDLATSKAVSSSTATRNEQIRGGVIGGGVGALLGTAAGFLARRVNSSLATQPLWIILLAGAAGGAVLGSLPGLLIGRRISRGQAGSRQNEVSPSRVLISIETDKPQDIENILRRNGAGEVHTTPIPAVQKPQAPPPAEVPAETGVANETRAAFGGVQHAPYAPALKRTRAPSLVVGAFANQTTANTAIDALLEAGFTSGQIRYSMHGTEGGGILKHLISMGVLSQVAQSYEQEFETGHTVVTVKTPDRQQEAQFLMTNHGGYNLRQFSSQPASPSAPPLQAMQDIKLREEQLR